MPPACLPLALMALANPTTPDAPLWNVTPHCSPRHIPRERTAYARSHDPLHTLQLFALLRGTTDTAQQAQHCTSAARSRSGSWPIAPLSSALDRERSAGPALMVQALPQLHSWCRLRVNRQQSRLRPCWETPSRSARPSEAGEREAQTSPHTHELRSTYTAEMQTHVSHTQHYGLLTGPEMSLHGSGWVPDQPAGAGQHDSSSTGGKRPQAARTPGSQDSSPGQAQQQGLPPRGRLAKAWTLR